MTGRLLERKGFPDKTTTRTSFIKSPLDAFESGISGVIYRGEIHGPVYGPVLSRLPRNAASTLCSVCLDFEQNCVRPESFVEAKDNNYKIYLHHGSLPALKGSMQNGCQLCKLLYNGYVYTCYALRKSQDEGKSLRAIESLIDQLEPSRPQLHLVFSPGHLLSPYRLNILMKHATPLSYPLVRMAEFAIAVKAGKKHPSSPSVSLVLTCCSDEPPFDTPGEVPRRRQCDATADFSLAKKWVTNCQNHHPSCKVAPACNPTRLLQIIDNTTSIKLVLTHPSQRYKYVTLSHRWGDFKPALTQRSNLQEHMRGIPAGNLPATFRDAVIATNQLGYQFLWIDSLCIIQDDEKDWETECPRMSSVFQGAALTIAVPGAKDSSVGFLHKRPLHDDHDYRPCELQYRDSHGNPINTIKIWYPGFHRMKEPPTDLNERLARVRDVGFFHDQSQVLGKEPESVLINRGWVVQETMLSSRILYFGSYQMYFECCSLTQDECTHDNLKDFSRFKSIVHFDSWKKSRWWFRFIEEYSRRALTFSSDRLPAISGIIHACKPPPGEVYLAGIWKSSLPEALLWRVSERTQNIEGPIVAPITDGTNDKSSAIVARQGYVAPSWSWASANKEVDFEDFQFTRFKGVSALEFISCSTTLVDSSADADPYGRVRAGYLEVRGKLCKAAVTRSSDPKFMCAWKLSSQGFFQVPAKFFPDNVSELLPQITTDINRPPESMDPGGAFPELYALAVGSTEEGWDGFGLLITPIFGSKNHFRRVGLLTFHDEYRGKYLEDMAGWFGESQIEVLTIV
ncbi:heterokaryon incompatibility protein [Fusarium tjaetaba]|uniref:Heterokaryon incompatibility protein n=1 Tax=Fusarium tjaetaba TaxID=1567544 RepID=A0A8H5VZL5_9HYPO|nr:heterokaryon incompatibility protein [Fusarium tjaetaba]KAF5643442.1 heterokaryon incompatibility protein [Fusarium tjaetaba]